MTWTHNICETCWEKREGQRVPYRLKNAGNWVCCFCGEGTNSGIAVRQDPKTMTCDHESKA